MQAVGMCLDSAVRIPQFYISRSPHRHLSKISSFLTSVLYSSISHLISAFAATPLNLSCLFLPRFLPSFDPRHLALLGFGGLGKRQLRVNQCECDDSLGHCWPLQKVIQVLFMEQVAEDHERSHRHTNK